MIHCIKFQIGPPAYERESLPPERWIAQQLRERRWDGCEGTYIRLTIEGDGVRRLTLSSPQQPSSGGGAQPTKKEQFIFDCWNQMGFSEHLAKPHELFVFLQQIGCR